jgi:PAS domain S-box-containing protein
MEDSGRARVSSLQVEGINVEWYPEQGICTFEKLPVAMMWVDTTLAGVMSGVQTMVGTARFVLALQSEGRKSVEADWRVISNYQSFRDGFKAIANIAAVAGWGHWTLTSLDEDRKECRFWVTDSWEGRYQRALGVCWGSGMLAGKLAGYCSKLFGTNCWADQTAFAARGDAYDEFLVRPSSRSIEKEIDELLASDAATRADMAVALRRLEEEIAERKRKEEALRQSEEKYRHLFEMESDALFLIDNATGQILEVNASAVALYGYSRDELLQKRNTDLSAEPEETTAATRGLRQRIPLRHHRKKTGVVFPVEITARHICWQNRQAHIAAIRDITERTVAEAERLEMERRLLHAQKLESLGVLAGGIAHDFNNLLMAVVGNLDLALLDVSATSPARSRIAQALQATRRGADLARQMLAYAGKGHLVTTRMDLSELVRENTNLFRAAIAKTAAMNLSLTSELSPIEADPGQVQQVIMNLITNASEAIGESAGVITLSTGVSECDDTYLSSSRVREKPPAGRFAYVEVSDTGCGMDDQTQQRIFDPFFTTKFAGRGLGMSAVLGIVQGHKGAIIVQSAAGQGTTIRVLFPACEAVNGAAAGAPAESTPPLMGGLRPEQVLVVDDEAAVRNICASFVRHFGFQAIIAANGEEALGIFKTHADDIGCVLLDLTMPAMDGISALREMKRVRPDIPVILCTGYDAQEARQRFVDEGLAGFIHKPYGLQDLKTELDRVLTTRTRTSAKKGPTEE